MQMKVLTLGILAAVYRGKEPKEFLSHSYVEDETFTLCGKIPAEHLADSNAYEHEGKGRPTCKRCLLLDPRFN